MKKILLPALALTLAAPAALAENVGDQIVTDAITYTVTAPGQVSASGPGTSMPTDLVIPASVTGTDGNTYAVKAIADRAFQYKGVTSVNVAGSVERIGANAFTGQSYNRKLTSVTLNEGVKYIGTSAFSLHALTEINIPASVDTIAKTAFLGGWQYSENKTLKKITFAEGVKYIGDGAFEYNQVLEDVVLPASLEEVGIELFLHDKALTKINIPAGLKTIGQSFIGGTSVSDIELDSANPYYTKNNGLIYTKDYSILQLAAPKSPTTSVTVNSRCKGIAGGAFWGANVTKVVLPNSIVAIDDYAFCQSQLKEITWSNKLAFIGEQAFAGTQFTEVTLPESFPVINDGQFAQCPNLTKVTIPSSVKEVYNHAFLYSNNLAEIVFNGSESPVILDAYESYEMPFYGLADNCVISVPAGAKASYNAQDYSGVTITEREASNLKVLSTDPEDLSTMAKYQPMSFTVTFDQQVKLLSSTASATYVRKGNGGSQNEAYSLSSSYVEPSDDWYVSLSSDKKSITVWGADYDMFTETFYNTGSDLYYVVIPEGLVQAVNGQEKNESITIRLYGEDSTTAVNDVNTADTQAVEVARYNAMGQRVDASTKGIQIIQMSNGTSRKILVK